MPMYQITSDESVKQLKSGSFITERALQKLVEKNLEALLGVRFMASEFNTGDRQRGRIDTLGLDQDGSPTIIEYKKTSKETVINQGLFYLDWLVDHKGDFTLAAQAAFGKNVVVDWSNPRLILIAESFTDYDKYAVNRIGANIELWVYRLYGDNLLFLDQIYTSTATSKSTRTTKPDHSQEKPIDTPTEEAGPIYFVEDHTKGKPAEIVTLFDLLRERIFVLDGEIIEKASKNYIAYKHGKNFCEVWIQASKLKIWLDISPTDLVDPLHLTRDVTKVGHWGTGDVEATLETPSQLESIMALVEQAYQQTV